MKPTNSIRSVVGPALLACGLVAVAWQSTTNVAGQGVQTVSAPTTAVAVPTYSKDVAPIIQAKCQHCHQAGSIGPMSLMSYADVRPWARAIRSRVSNGEMPPWPIDKTVGIQKFVNDHSLSDAEIDTIVRWADNKAPEGNPKDLPPPRKFRDYLNSWSYEEEFGRPPDLVVKSPVYKVVANGMDQFPPMQTKIVGLEKERWIRAIEIKPGNPRSRYVFHHANPSMTQDGRTSPLIASAVGTEGQIFPDDAGKLIKPGATVNFGMHFWPIGEDVDADMQLGLWFYPENEKPRFQTQGQQQFRTDSTTGNGLGNASHSRQIARRADLLIPPHGTAMFRGTYVLDKSARIHDLRGHMHKRGKYQMVEAIYPDGRSELINKLNWSEGWHTTFVYEKDARPLLPKGTVLILTSFFDNTKREGNPDPDQWVVAGSRTVDEMAHIWIGITYFENAADFQELVAERNRVKTTTVAAGRQDQQ
jgi:hypothetical protein